MDPNSPLAQDQDYVWREESIIKAIEIAENEMVEKSLEAYKYECICNFDGYCRERVCKVKCDGPYQEYVEFFSSSFLNPSIGRFIEEFGLDTLKNKFVFNNITKKQIEFFNKYIKNFAN